MSAIEKNVQNVTEVVREAVEGASQVAIDLANQKNVIAGASHSLASQIGGHENAHEESTKTVITEQSVQAQNEMFQENESPAGPEI